VSVDELHYLECQFGSNEVVDSTNNSMGSHFSLKGYSLKVAYGMMSKSKENGNAILMWYMKKDKI
jgi:hypothetical protein